MFSSTFYIILAVVLFVLFIVFISYIKAPPSTAFIVSGLNPAVFGGILAAVRHQAESDPKKPGAILINAWNEYTEGCYLMPDKWHGDAFLREVRRICGKSD